MRKVGSSSDLNEPRRVVGLSADVHSQLTPISGVVLSLGELVVIGFCGCLSLHSDIRVRNDLSMLTYVYIYWVFK